ncbi:Bifunctional ligase/repressor BirA [Candidatus Cyrtobacter comes]|uniref:biotin--[biotin carboxyl-carrier protein] ligase n=1 Tax=Candidatus Cyrtobacter comes TaxID=675776 RepID=A0ABU5L9E4_9RICK|nr:biotin--[acetyl-CoA-carboxylase] ligase [Candidatus Cyrtobacter comes]MDZ5762530.1 Bifunctional ligase/repressor BirA [Candidatus Cyrtobacter comes]
MPLGEFDLISYSSIESTQTGAIKLLNSGHRTPFVVKTDHQISGFGKYNREWYSLPGDIAITIAITPTCDESSWPMLTYVAALSVGELLTGIEITYKWPNDIMVDNKKLSGILLERYKNHLLIGIGINVIKKDGIISLSELGCTEMSVSSIIENFKLLYNNYILNGFSYIKTKWLNKARIGSMIRSTLPDGRIIDGIFNGIEDDGTLIVINKDGALNKIYAADTQIRYMDI